MTISPPHCLYFCHTMKSFYVCTALPIYGYLLLSVDLRERESECNKPEEEEEEEDLFEVDSIEKFTPEFKGLPWSPLNSSQPRPTDAQEVPELSPVGDEVRGEECGESSSVAPDMEDGAELSLPERPDAILSDEEVCFPSLDRFGGFSVTLFQDTKNAMSCSPKQLLVSQSESTQFWLEFSANRTCLMADKHPGTLWYTCTHT